MKKCFILFIGLLMINVSYSQIVLSHVITLEENTTLSRYIETEGILCITDDDVCVVFGYDTKRGHVYLYDVNSGQCVHTLSAPANMNLLGVAKNVFTSDNSYAILCSSAEYINSSYLARVHFYVYDATGSTVLADLGELYGYEYVSTPYIAHFSSGYKLCMEGYADSSANGRVLKIYSLPGQGGNSSVREIPQTAPRSRKFMRDQQVLIEHNDNIYTTEGRLIK